VATAAATPASAHRRRLYTPTGITRKIFIEVAIPVIINVWHPKGGTGKTTVATSLAIALSKSRGRTLYVELGLVPAGVRLLGA